MGLLMDTSPPADFVGAIRQQGRDLSRGGRYLSVAGTRSDDPHGKP
jgi:hypothetical protein